MKHLFLFEQGYQDVYYGCGRKRVKEYLRPPGTVYVNEVTCPDCLIGMDRMFETGVAQVQKTKRFRFSTPKMVADRIFESLGFNTEKE